MNEMNSILFLNERKHILKSNIQLFFKFVGSKFDSQVIFRALPTTQKGANYD